MLNIEIFSVLTHVLLFGSLYFEVFLLVSFLERLIRTKEIEIATAVQLPSITIVVPCFNEEHTVARTVDSLLALIYPKENLRVVIVDDGSTDATYAAIRQYSNHPQVTLLQKENGGKHSALNLALKQTRTDLIGCLDADSEVSPHALARIAHGFRDPRVTSVTPGIHVKDPVTLLQHMQKAEYRMSVFIRSALAGLGSIFITPGPFSIFRTEVVRSLGGWRHGHSTEDLEMGLRMQDLGYLILNDPRASVYTIAPRTIRGLFRQRVRWTYGFLRNVLDYRHMIFNPKYGNLGLLILPISLFTIGGALYLAGRMFWSIAMAVADVLARFAVTGWLGFPSLDPFFINTSVLWITVYLVVAVTFGIVCIGSFISTGSRLPPRGTPLFLALYSFIVPFWLGAALVRAIMRTGVRWK